MPETGRSIERRLEEETLAPEDALAPLVRIAQEAPALSQRLEAYRVLGSISGRAFQTSWDVAEKAAFALLEIAVEADASAERVGLLHAMGRGFRNLWFLPYVHARLSDDDETVVAAALSAAGGLAFPALEEAIAAAFLGEETSRPLRLAAIAALGRMGAESAATRLLPFVEGTEAEAAAALSALTEIRSRVGEAAALATLARDPPRAVMVAAMRYLAEIGQPDVLRTLRRLARDEDADLRIAAGLASRAFKAETTTHADERILAALTERDRAVRAALARRLRTLPVAEVLAQAELFLGDESEGVVQIVAELRAPEVTRLLVRLALDPNVPLAVRARAAGSIEANEPWEQDELVALVDASTDVAVRVAAAQTLGAFAPLAFVLDHLAPLADDRAPELRAALLWALQLGTRPRAIAPAERARAEAILERALVDPDPKVRKRAAYVAGNLDAASLVPNLVALARGEDERADLRLAAFVALGEIGSSARFSDLVFLWNREHDPDALGAAGRALERAAFAPRAEDDAPPSLDRVHDRLPKLLASPDPTVRAAAVRVASLAKGAVAAPVLATIAALVDDPAPRVREQTVVALGRPSRPEHEPILVHALADLDPAIQERAALALLALGSATARAAVVDFVSRTADRAAALRIAVRIESKGGGQAGPESFAEALGAALARVSHDDPVYEELLALKVDVLEATRPTKVSGDVDASIAALFPTWTRLSVVRGFEPLGKSLRTAEMLFGSAGRGRSGEPETDLSAAIVLWMKCLEGYLHAWLAPRLRALQNEPRALFELTDRVLGGGWSSYQRYLEARWLDPVVVGELSVEVPLRSSVNALRELQERRLKSLDSPASVTEWSRLMLFFAVDHASGAKNVLKLTVRDAEKTVRLAHRLQVLAQVRNAVTHRQVAGAGTLGEFRKAYYSAFEELTGMA